MKHDIFYSFNESKVLVGQESNAVKNLNYIKGMWPIKNRTDLRNSVTKKILHPSDLGAQVYPKSLLASNF